MQSVRTQLTVDSEMSLEFARLDTSKSCDSHAIVMRRERRASLPRNGRAVLRPGSERWASAMLPDVAGCFASMRRSQSYVGFWNDYALLSGLARIHAVVPVIDGQNLLSIQSHLNECLVLLRKPEPINVWYCRTKSARWIQNDSCFADGLQSALPSNPLHQSKASPQINTCPSAWAGPRQ